MPPVIMRIILSVAVSLIVGFGVLRAWDSLKRSGEQQVAHIAEAESYASRAQLIRNVERAIATLENVYAFWATYGAVPRAQWQGDAELDLTAVPGTRLLLWDDPRHGVRYAYTPEHPAFDFRPDEEQWKDYAGLLERARAATRDTMAGPFVDAAGRPYLETYLLSEAAPEGGRLVAVIDARDALQAFLADESPGYALEVLWRDQRLYGRGTLDRNLQVEWVREGYIRTSLGPLWKVVHAPTAELVKTFISPAVDLLLLLGLVIAVLMGTLTFENWRAHSRAAAAERAERELAALNRDLEQQVLVRTRQLEARTADLQTLSDSVAHDMRSPLSVIATNLQLFQARQQDRLDEHSLAPLQRIQRAVRQAAGILERMLGLTSVAHATFARGRLDMEQLVREVWQGLKDTDPEPPSIEIGPLQPVDADRTLVSVLVLNLLSNAIKYTRAQPHPRIEFSCSSRDGIPVYCVSDNGIGFDPQMSDRLFRAFDRLGRGAADTGLGLGLTIAARVVERHGGRIWAEGKAGESAAFYFTLEPQPEARTEGSAPVTT